jgi:hypothetical protein
LTICLVVTQTHLVFCQRTLLYLFTSASPDVGLNLTTTTNLTSQGNGFCLSCPNYLIVHGWHGSKSKWMAQMKNELFKQDPNINVFIVDWGFGSDLTSYSIGDDLGHETSIKYINTTVREIWSYLGSYSNNSWIIKSNSSGGILNFHCIGHSLGSHVCGLIGKLAKSSSGLKFARISGLDPAGPCFDLYEKWNRLNKEDADHVASYTPPSC